MDKLRELDQIAYIRFASVYQSFEDLEDAQARGRHACRAQDDAATRRGLQRGSTDERPVRPRHPGRPRGRRRVRIDPYDPADLQPSSVDLHLDAASASSATTATRTSTSAQPQPDLTELLTIEDDEPFILHPGEFVLGQTLEWVELPDDLVARLEGKSSLGRLGLLIHSTAGYVDPGWKGNLTLELSNVANLPIALYFGMRIGQITLLQDVEPGRAAVRLARARLEVPGPVRADRVGVPPRLRARVATRREPPR